MKLVAISKEPYKTLPGDIMILVNAKPETFSDLEIDLRMMHCKSRDGFELIWGPTGQERRKSMLHFLKMNYTTLICAPTNVAITEVASRSFSSPTCSMTPLTEVGFVLL
ncbi:hypothetical protein G4B88_029942 [Cannabis sativa]|uniref:DUF6469 domain-containing protein n=1 Tax=Cannabis sativa TaxID=3483 RepID=A0A7J6GCM5_CANSA|nr:hypothetical protein G4B88_029942 [Cannabis sativa]